MQTERATRTIQVMVADDHPIVRRGVIHELGRYHDIMVIGECVNGYDVLQRMQEQQPDVLVLDISMPGVATSDVLTQIAQLYPATKVLILTAHTDSEYILVMLRAGAKGYVLKDEHPETITKAVRSVARGEIWLSAPVIACVVNQHTQVATEPEPPSLSTREAEVLDQLIQGKDNQAIGDALCISERTVRFHLRNIYDKLAIQHRTEAIAWGLRMQLTGRFPLAVGAGRLV